MNSVRGSPGLFFCRYLSDMEETTQSTPAVPAPVPGNGTQDFIHVLRSPLTSGGRTLDRLNLDFDKLKAKGLKALAKEFRERLKAEKDNTWVAVPWADERYQLMCVARLNGIIYEDLDELGGTDAVAVMGAARDFFVEGEK